MVRGTGIGLCDELGLNECINVMIMRGSVLAKSGALPRLSGCLMWLHRCNDEDTF